MLIGISCACGRGVSRVHFETFQGRKQSYFVIKALLRENKYFNKIYINYKYLPIQIQPLVLFQIVESL